MFRHEQTLSKPKADRLDLLRATRAHFGQIFMLYSGAGKVDALLVSAIASDHSNKTSPDIEVTDEYGVVHRVWKISDPTTVASMHTHMRDKKLIIADGHHRYETALTYRNEWRATAETGSGNSPEPFDSVMMTFVDMDRPGLVILPTHRLVFGLPVFSVSQFQAVARRYFNIEDVDPGIDAARATTILQQAGHAGTRNPGRHQPDGPSCSTPQSHRHHFVRKTLSTPASLRCSAITQMPAGGCLKISEEAIRNQENVSVLPRNREALSQVKSGKAQIAFLMNPVRMEQVRDLAFAGEVLPQKSTDFYPKLLSGLTIYALE